MLACDTPIVRGSEEDFHCSTMGLGILLLGKEEQRELGVEGLETEADGW